MNCQHEIVKANFELELARIKHFRAINHITLTTTTSGYQEYCSQCGTLVICNDPILLGLKTNDLP